MRIGWICLILCVACAAPAQDLPAGAVELPTDVPEEETAVPAADTEAVRAGKQTNTVPVVDRRLKFLSTAGMQYAEEGEYEEAERAYLTALEADPDHPEVLFRLSTLYIFMERYTDAVSILKDLTEKYPDNAQTRNNLAWIYATGKGVINGKLAVRYARDAILIAPASAPLWNTLAEAYFVSGDYDRALRSSEQALELLARQGAGEERFREFAIQKNKIERAREAYKQFVDAQDDE